MANRLEYVVGTKEAIEAEYGYDVFGPFGIVTIYNGDFLNISPCQSMQDALASAASALADEIELGNTATISKL